jgi:K+-sensing histidine kinase KdpD
VPESAVLEALPDGAALFGADGRLAAVNRRAAELTGEAPESLAGLEAAAWRAMLRKAFKEVPEPEGEEWTLRLETSFVPRRNYEWLSRPVSGGGRLELLRDASEAGRRSAEVDRLKAQHARQLETLRARAEQAEKFKMDLTANVTHDLRTPLASIKASVSGLLAGDVSYDPHALRETLSVIDEETDRLQRRVQNLLSMAKMEAGDSLLSRDWVDVTDVIASALESLRSIRGGRDIRLEFADDLPLVYGDYDQLLIAARNLIENAFLYSPADSPVEVSAAASLGQMRIRVRDYGTGLMPDEFERVFDKFYRGRAARRIPGTGLGLPICRGIAEAHAGRLWAEHAPGGGVAFVLSIPLEPQPDNQLETEGHG